MSPAPLPFSALALDRAADRREDAGWLDQAWWRGRLLEVDFEGRVAAPVDATLPLGRSCVEVAAERPPAASFLGLAGATPWFALPAPAALAPALGLREAAVQWGAFEAGLFAYAKALLLWQSRARYCGACGAPTRLERAGHCQRCSAEHCGLEHYPRTDAAVIVLVTDGERGLIGRGAHWPERRFSTLAGFVEPGESLEDALRREVFEEAGVRVGGCHYRSSQPWPFPASLMVGFRAEATDPRLQLGDELIEARWIERADYLQAVAAGELLAPPPISLSFRLLADWLLEQLPAEQVQAVLGAA